MSDPYIFNHPRNGETEVYLAARWVVSGFFKANVEYTCGCCGRHNRKHAPVRDPYTGFAWSSCSYCGEYNMFRTGDGSNGKTRLLTLG